MKLVFTVPPGLEDVAAAEIKAELGGETAYRMLTGYVVLETNSPRLQGIYRLRTVNRAFILLTEATLSPEASFLPRLYEVLYAGLSRVVDYVTPETSFAVQAERVGEHEYTSLDIARILGDVVIRVVEERYGRRPRVNLRNPAVIIHAYARGERLVVGVAITGPWSMHRRGYRVYEHPASLKPTIASAMLYLSGTRDKQVIIDPMCGGGTIAIEAALVHEDAEIYCGDINPRHLRGALYNAIAAGVRERIRLNLWDARRIHEFVEDVDHMVLNPPYGIRYGSPAAIRGLYRRFLDSAWRALRSGGRVTMITTEHAVTRRLLEKRGYRLIHERVVYHGGLYPHIIVFEKP